ncbi:hypothetical protein [uncultured Paraglaciecola sp.]|uniref:hypothetical protein n=1 Tax=uncultured Paraglaciecola sp. TaxID=1765024 RepID=UPI00260F60AA|nr:hypothetical protein [uncultured Paraglaciecola sp.]
MSTSGRFKPIWKWAVLNGLVVEQEEYPNNLRCKQLTGQKRVWMRIYAIFNNTNGIFTRYGNSLQGQHVLAQI